MGFLIFSGLRFCLEGRANEAHSGLNSGWCVLYSFSMGKRGQWSRWGRGMCEGGSLELGNAFRGAVVRQDHFAS